MLVSVIQVKFDYTTGKYTLKETALNPEYVVSVDEETKVSQELRVYEAKDQKDWIPGSQLQILLWPEERF